MSGQNILVFVLIGGLIAAFVYVNVIMSKKNKK